MTNSLKLAVFALGALGLVSCGTVKLPPTYPIYGVMKTTELVDDGSVQTAERGDMLLVQNVRGVKAVEITEDTEFTFGKLLGKTKMELSEGFQLYAMVSPLKKGKYFCGYNNTAKSGALYIKGIDPLNRSCFVDEDEDGRFDGAFILPSQNTSMFGGGTMGDPFPLEAKIPYRDIAIEDAPLGEIGVWYAKDNRLYVVSVEGEKKKKEVISSGEVRVKKIESFPKTVSISGMDIEIISIDADKVMTYKIVKPLPEDFLITQRTTVSYSYY